MHLIQSFNEKIGFIGRSVIPTIIFHSSIKYLTAQTAIHINIADIRTTNFYLP